MGFGNWKYGSRQCRSGPMRMRSSIDRRQSRNGEQQQAEGWGLCANDITGWMNDGKDKPRGWWAGNKSTSRCLIFGTSWQQEWGWVRLELEKKMIPQDLYMKSYLPKLPKLNGCKIPDGVNIKCWRSFSTTQQQWFWGVGTAGSGTSQQKKKR